MVIEVQCRYCGECHASRDVSLCRRVFQAVQQEEQAHRARRAVSQGVLAHRIAVLEGPALDDYLLTIGQQRREGR